MHEGDELALFFVDGSIEPQSSHTLVVAALCHLDESRAHVFLGNGFDGKKINGWYLNTSATHPMTGRWDFSELDSSVRSSVKFGDAFAVEIKGVGSVFSTAKPTSMGCSLVSTYIPALRNSSVSLGQLDENGLCVEIKHGVLHI